MSEGSHKSSVQSEIIKLENEIRYLKQYISCCESQLEIQKFGEIQDDIKYSYLTHAKENALSDPNIKYQENLFYFTGIICTEFNKKIILQFPIAQNISKSKHYIVEIIKTDDKIILERFIMPFSVEMNDILSIYPLHDLTNLPNFAKLCRNYIDCFLDRQNQYDELQEYISNTENCFVDTNCGYTAITLQLKNIRKTKIGNINVLLSLSYPSAGTRPINLEVDLIQNLSEDNNLNLKKHFKHFKTMTLKEAIIQISEHERNEFIWNRLPKKDFLSADFTDEQSEQGMNMLAVTEEEILNTEDTFNSNSNNIKNNLSLQHSNNLKRKKKCLPKHIEKIPGITNVEEYRQSKRYKSKNNASLLIDLTRDNTLSKKRYHNKICNNVQSFHNVKKERTKQKTALSAIKNSKSKLPNLRIMPATLLIGENTVNEVTPMEQSTPKDENHKQNNLSNNNDSMRMNTSVVEKKCNQSENLEKSNEKKITKDLESNSFIRNDLTNANNSMPKFKKLSASFNRYDKLSDYESIQKSNSLSEYHISENEKNSISLTMNLTNSNSEETDVSYQEDLLKDLKLFREKLNIRQGISKHNKNPSIMKKKTISKKPLQKK